VTGRKSTPNIASPTLTDIYYCSDWLL